MVDGQRQRLYSGVRMFTGNYLSSTPRELRVPGVELELRSLIYIYIYIYTIPALYQYQVLRTTAYYY
jgi:hypothetical protein